MVKYCLCKGSIHITAPVCLHPLRGDGTKRIENEANRIWGGYIWLGDNKYATQATSIRSRTKHADKIKCLIDSLNQTLK